MTIKIDKDWLYQKYVIEKMNTHQIGKLLNVPHITIRRKLEKFGIHIRSQKEALLLKNENLLLLNNKDWLYQKYINEQFSIDKIAEIVKCDHGTVVARLNKYNIPIRGLFKKLNIPKDTNEKEWLYQKYVIEKLSAYKIGNILNVSESIIRRRLIYYNILTRTVKESREIRFDNINRNLLNNKKWLYKKYVTEKKTTYDIAKILNCSNCTVGKQLNIFNIPTREIKGENSSNWKGGVSFEPYCSKFNNQLKEQIRNKFNRECFLCGKFEEDNNCKLHIHHVDYNKGQGCGHKWSLVPLCSSCHAKTNNNRWYWFNLLNNYWVYKYLSDSLPHPIF